MALHRLYGKAGGLPLGLSLVAWERHPLPNDRPANLLFVHPGPPCMRQLLSRLIFNRLVSSARPGFRWPPRAVTVKGGRRPSRSDLPLTVTRWQADVGQATRSENRRRQFRGELAIRREDRAHPCIRSIREDRNHDAVIRISGEAPGQRTHSSSRLGSHGGNIGSHWHSRAQIHEGAPRL